MISTHQPLTKYKAAFASSSPVPPAAGPFYATTPAGESTREALIESHLPKVKYIADRIASRLPSSVERDDLYGAGVIGLIEAAERFDPARGIAFTTFAELRVRGAIFDSLRELDWASRAARRRARDVQAAFAAVERERGRPATEEEVAGELGVSLHRLHELLSELRGLTVTELEGGVDDEHRQTPLETLFDTAASPLEQYETNERRERLARAVDCLPERERQVIALYYVEELTMKEIGAVLGVTESRVSQMRTRAIVRLRATLSTMQ